MKKYKVLWILVIISVIMAAYSNLWLNMWFGFWVLYAIYDSLTGGK